jgi:hypothetical protein
MSGRDQPTHGDRTSPEVELQPGKDWAALRSRATQLRLLGGGFFMGAARPLVRYPQPSPIQCRGGSCEPGFGPRRRGYGSCCCSIGGGGSTSAT